MKYLVFLIIFFVSPLSLADEKLDKEYSTEFTNILEFVYGDQILSQGGTESIDMMFEGIDLTNKEVLDFGSGLGGVDLYLTAKYNTSITGVDRVKHLVDKSNSRATNTNLKGKVSFLHVDLDNSLTVFEDNSFDIIFSKESVLHVENKEQLFKAAKRILKPGGLLVILDWLRPAGQLGPNIRKMMELDELDFEMLTTRSYHNILESAGFQDIQILNKNSLYAKFTQENLNLINTHRDAFIDKFDQKTHTYSTLSWMVQKQAFENKEVLISLIKARK